MPRTAVSPLEHVALAALWLVTGIALVGYATFGLHPALLAGAPNAAPAYAAAFTIFPRAQILLAFAVCALALIRRAGLRWLPAFAAAYLVSLASELVGTTFGVPFGAYHYTDGLGPKWLGHVPVLIPLSWFVMALPSYLLARRAVRATLPARTRATVGVVVGSLVLLAWDLALDPAMSRVTSYWRWLDEGSYYGMPLSNLAGWYVTGVALMATLWLARADEWSIALSTRWLVAFYCANLVLPLGMITFAAMWGAVAVSAAAVVLCLWLPRLLAMNERTPARRPLAREIP